MSEKKSTEMSRFATFLKEKRTAMGMSLEQLSVKAFGNKSGRGYIHDIETGFRTGITISKMEKLLQALNSEIKYIEN